MKKEILKQILEKNDESSKMIFNLYFVNLISSDTCIDTKSCSKSLMVLKELKSYLNEFDDIDSNIKEEYLKKIDEGIEIVEEDLKSLKNGNIFHC